MPRMYRIKVILEAAASVENLIIKNHPTHKGSNAAHYTLSFLIKISQDRQLFY